MGASYSCFHRVPLASRRSPIGFLAQKYSKLFILCWTRPQSIVKLALPNLVRSFPLGRGLGATHSIAHLGSRQVLLGTSVQWYLYDVFLLTWLCLFWIILRFS